MSPINDINFLRAVQGKPALSESELKRIAPLLEVLHVRKAGLKPNQNKAGPSVLHLLE